MNLLVTIPAESRRMNVGKDVIRVLGSPTYICVLQRKDRKSIVITPCTAEHPMSFKVPDRLLTDGQCRMMINGIQFIHALLETNGLAVGKDHQFKGRFGLFFLRCLHHFFRSSLTACSSSRNVETSSNNFQLIIAGWLSGTIRQLSRGFSPIFRYVSS